MSIRISRKAVNHRLQGPAPRFLPPQVWGGARECAFLTSSSPRRTLPVQGPYFEKHQLRALARWPNRGSGGHDWSSEAPVGSWPLAVPPGVPTLEEVWPATALAAAGCKARLAITLPGQDVQCGLHTGHGTLNPAPGEAGGMATCLLCTRILQAQVALSLHLRGQMRT